jgi:FAD/FMN-containing dehydrogenase
MTTPHTPDARIPSTKIERGDPRYRAVLDKRFNKRFSASPDYVRLVDSTEQVRVAVEEAVSEGRRVVVTSGGHCLESAPTREPRRLARTKQRRRFTAGLSLDPPRDPSEAVL